MIRPKPSYRIIVQVHACVNRTMFTRQGGGVWQAQSAFWLATPRKEETLVCVAPCKYSTEERCSGLSLGPVHCFSVQCSLRSATAYCRLGMTQCYSCSQLDSTPSTDPQQQLPQQLQGHLSGLQQPGLLPFLRGADDSTALACMHI